MTITFRCPACNNQFRIDEQMRGQKVRCPNTKCQSVVLIPNSDSASQPASVKQVKPTRSRSESNNISSATPLPAMTPGALASQLSKQHLLMGVLVLFVLGCAVTVSVFLARADSSSDPFSDLVSKTVPPNQLPTEAENEAARADEQAQEQRHDLEERERKEKLAADEAKNKKASEEKLAANQQAERLRQEAKEAQAKAAREAAMRADGAFPLIATDPRWQDNHGQWLFELPPPDENSIAVSLPLRTQGREVELSLCDAADSLFQDCPTKLELLRSSDAKETWLVVATQAGTRVELGEYTLETMAAGEPIPEALDHQLSFRWRREAAREILAAELLRWWPLQISVGDRSAVLLQRAAYVSEVPLKWESIVNSQKIIFPRSPEMQAIDGTPNALLTFCIEIQQPDTVPQTLCLDLGNRDVEQGKQAPVETAAECSTNFPLALPWTFQDTVPEVHESPLGIGTLNIQVSRTLQTGLVIHPKLELKLRLPGNRHLETFPNAETLDAFQTLAREPEQIRNLTSTVAIRNIAMQMIQQTRDEHEFWHQQPLRSIARKSSFDPVFMDRAKASIRAMKQIIRNAERAVNVARAKVVDQQRQMATLVARAEAGGGALFARMLDSAQNGLAELQQELSHAETRLVAVRRLGPDIESYCEDLSELIDLFTEQHETLMQDYDAIEIRVNELLNASQSGHFRLRGEMSAVIEIPAAENGPSIRIHFVESSSHAVQ